MAFFMRFERSDSLEVAPIHQAESRHHRRSGLAVGLGALVLIGSAGQLIEATDTQLEPLDDTTLETFEFAQELAIEQERLLGVEVERLTRQAEAEIEKVRLNPYQNKREIVILRDEPFVKEHGDYLEEIAKEFDINVNHLVATGMVESCLTPSINDSHVGAQGAFQVMPNYLDWFRERYGDGEYDPQNILHSTRMGAAAYTMLLSEVETEGLSDKELLLVGGTVYNAGPARADKLVASDFATAVLPTETQGHLEELVMIFDERVQDRDGTTRCASR